MSRPRRLPAPRIAGASYESRLVESELFAVDAHPRTNRLVLALTGAVLVYGGSFAATIRVPDDLPTIQAAIDTSARGDTVRVPPGVYRENVELTRVAFRQLNGAQPSPEPDRR